MIGWKYKATGWKGDYRLEGLAAPGAIFSKPLSRAILRGLHPGGRAHEKASSAHSFGLPAFDGPWDGAGPGHRNSGRHGDGFLHQPKGAFVNIVTPGASIARAGLLAGDVIAEADGKPVASAAALQQILARHNAGDSIAVDAVHLGKPGHFTLVLTALAGAPAQMAASAPRQTAPQSATQSAPAPRAATDPAAGVQWTQFADPAEHAFTMRVPAGWRVQGGTVRKNPIEIPMGVNATSPDGGITIFYSDPNVPIYSVPAPVMGMAGLRAGMIYNMGQGVSTVIEPYMDGATFAARWRLGRIGNGCAQVRLITSRARPDTTQGLDRAYAQLRTSVKAGEASFACSLQRKSAGGYVFAAHELVRSPPTTRRPRPMRSWRAWREASPLIPAGCRASSRPARSSTRRWPRPMLWSCSASRTMRAPRSRPART
jgi:hypothetical protein